MTTKSQLIEAVAGETGDSKAVVGRVLDSALRAIAGAEKVTLTGFGTFLCVTRPPRQGRNPRTGEVIEIPERQVLTFKPSKTVGQS